MYGRIYLIWNMLNGKKYVGQTTKTIEERFNQHAMTDSIIGNAIRKYGAENFHYGVIKTCASKDELDKLETFFIAVLYCKVPYGYNLTDGGEGIAGWKHKPETLTKMSETHKGKTLSAETRKNISASKRGDKNPFFGRHHTLESSKKISVARRGKKHSLETRAKISASHKGKIFTPEHCAHISAAKKGQPLSTETFAKLSTARRGDSQFKNLLRELNIRQISYHRLAELMDLSYPSVSAKMLGNRNFTARDKKRLEEIFSKPIEYLLTRDK